MALKNNVFGREKSLSQSHRHKIGRILTEERIGFVLTVKTISAQRQTSKFRFFLAEPKKSCFDLKSEPEKDNYAFLNLVKLSFLELKAH